MSTLYVDNLQPNLGSRVMAAGHVVQVVQGPYSNRLNFNQSLTTGTTIYSAPTITPTSSNSKILIMAQHTTERATGSSGDINGTGYVYTSIYEGTTQLATNGYSGSLANAHGYMFPVNSRQSAAGSFLYDVASTDPLTFHIKCSGGVNVSNNNWYFYGCAMTLMEIAQ